MEWVEVQGKSVDVAVAAALDELGLSSPDEATIAGLLKKLAIEPIDLIRKKEHRELKLPPTDDPRELIARMAAHPRIIERPIVVCGRAARLGRPPESVLEIL